MKSSRRHDSLIPLSREHQYGLMLCLRIRQGLASRGEDVGWLRAKAKDVISFFEGELTAHFKAEEEVLFPAMQELSAASELIRELLEEHRRLEGLVRQLQRADGVMLGDVLKEFAGLLESHIRKEERELFPIYELHVPPAIAQTVGQEIVSRIGEALRPRDPDLLK